jgi:putative zinc finger protein
MSNHLDHLDFARLSDYADESLAPAERARVQEHLAQCADCAERLAGLRRLLGAASALPAEVTPPGEQWQAIRARISQPARARAVSSRTRWLSAPAWALAAAAVLLVVLSSAITTVIVRRQLAVRIERAPTPVEFVQLPPAARDVEAHYVRTASELAEALAGQRGKLDPATVAKVEASLRVIDQAIDEARRALAGDPANLTLLDLLTANYERKLELLRRATELPAST